MLKALFFSLFVFTGHFALDFRADESSDCGNFTVSFTTMKEANGTKLEVEASGGSAPYKYIFYKESGDLLSDDLDSKSVSGLQQGKHFCIIVDKKNCKKTIEIEIN